MHLVCADEDRLQRLQRMQRIDAAADTRSVELVSRTYDIGKNPPRDHECDVAPPAVGETVPVRMRLTTTYVDEVVIS